MDTVASGGRYTPPTTTSARRERRRSRRRERLERRQPGRAKRMAMVLGAGVLAPVTPHVAAPAAAGPGDTRVPMQDPHTVWDGGGSDYTFGSTQRGYDGCTVAWNTYRVPWIRHAAGGGTGSTLGGTCYGGDALAEAPDHGADLNDQIWAPSVVRFGGQYIMHYTARKQGTGQRCIWRATSDTMTGPYKTQSEWACPPGGRWAIDPAAFVAGGQLYVTYRDDYAYNVPGQSAISVVRTNSAGEALWDTRRTALTSADVSWDTTRLGESMVENPVMVPWSNGHYYLFFSGSDWATDRYATGIADCGTSPLPASRCKPLEGANRPYFGYSGSTPAPFRTLPTNQRGPGGMTPYRSAGGWRATWHWAEAPTCPWNPNPCDGPRRFSRNASLTGASDGSSWKVG